MTPDFTPPFTPFPKIGRLEKDMVITEKIDGTNAAVVVTPEGSVYAQSRKRVITPTQDNMGFARWVAEHEDELREGLGEGVHFGEWWGLGVQRGYGLDEKRFSLFNVHRWTTFADSTEAEHETNDLADEFRCVEVPRCHVVPVLRRHTFDTDVVREVYVGLRTRGSVAAPGFMKPEGVVVFHTANGTLFKLSDAKVPPPEHDRSAVMT